MGGQGGGRAQQRGPGAKDDWQAMGQKEKGAGNRKEEKGLAWPIPQKDWSDAWLLGVRTLGCSTQPLQLPQLGAPGVQRWGRMGGKKSSR